MPKIKDDFGFVKPLNSGPKKGAGLFLPRNLIGRSILDVASTEPGCSKAEPRFNGIRDLLKLAGSRRQGTATARTAENLTDIGCQDGDVGTPVTPATGSRDSASPRKRSNAQKYSAANPQMESHVDELVFHHDIDRSGESAVVELQEKAFFNRRLKKTVLGADGCAISVQTQSANNGRQSAIRHTDNTPAPQKHWQAGSKRQFAWVHRPTAWNSTITYEDPPEPGKRPSHPVCAVGVVATDRMRSYPEKIAEQSRHLLDDEQEEAEVQLSETALSIRAMKYPDTKWLTQWHWNPKVDVDRARPKKFSVGEPVPGWTSAREQSVWRPAAGKPGASDHYNISADAAEVNTAPLTAR